MFVLPSVCVQCHTRFSNGNDNTARTRADRINNLHSNIISHELFIKFIGTARVKYFHVENGTARSAYAHEP